MSRYQHLVGLLLAGGVPRAHADQLVRSRSGYVQRAVTRVERGVPVAESLAELALSLADERTRLMLELVDARVQRMAGSGRGAP